jgi:hypothetical protein
MPWLKTIVSMPGHAAYITILNFQKPLYIKFKEAVPKIEVLGKPLYFEITNELAST